MHAICVFVKTPGYSPVKTRLAASIGESRALQFYENALLATKNMISECMSRQNNLRGVWAVAEKAAMLDSHWRGWPTLWQGEGSLGARLSHIESLAFQEHQSVLFFGADAPHVPAESLLKAYIELERQDVVVGPCEDGGFYFLLTRKPLGETVWKNVEYSTENTWRDLKKQIQKIHPDFKIKETETNFDVDTEDEYLRACALLPELAGPTG